MDKNLYTQHSNEASERMLAMIRSGKIRNHKLVYSSPVHFGDIERNERNTFEAFIRSRNFYDLLALKGESYYE